MKMLLCCVLTVALCTTSVSTKTESFLYVGSGIGFPLSPDEVTNQWKAGLLFNGAMGFMLNPTFEISGRVAYNTFPLDEEYLIKELEYIFGPLPGLRISGSTLSALQLGVDFKYVFPTKNEAVGFKPYVFAGVGVAIIRVSDLTVSYGYDSGTADIDGETKPCLDFGFGSKVRVSSSVDFYFDGRYVLVFTEDESFGFFPVHVGLSIGVGN